MHELHERHQHRQDIEEARDQIHRLLESGVNPRVTVLREHLPNIMASGLRRRDTSYQRGVRAIIGTLGISPFLPQDEDRVILELAVHNPQKIGPRFTGPDQAFNGVVEILTDRVPPEQIRVIDPLQANEKAA